jgi:hypothetical protein
MRTAILGEGMRRRGEVDTLSSQHVHFVSRSAEPLEMREVGMEIEGRHAIEKL